MSTGLKYPIPDIGMTFAPGAWYKFGYKFDWNPEIYYGYNLFHTEDFNPWLKYMHEENPNVTINIIGPATMDEVLECVINNGTFETMSDLDKYFILNPEYYKQ